MRRARWYASRGYPHSFIAEKLHVSRTTVRKWCVRFADDRAVQRLVSRLRAMPDVQRQEVFERAARKAAS